MPRPSPLHSDKHSSAHLDFIVSLPFPPAQAPSILNFKTPEATYRPRLPKYGRHTKHRNSSSRLGEDSEGADILLRKGVLDSGDEGAGTGGDEGGLDGVADGVFGLVLLFRWRWSLLFFGHCREKRGGERESV